MTRKKIACVNIFYDQNQANKLKKNKQLTQRNKNKLWLLKFKHFAVHRT